MQRLVFEIQSANPHHQFAKSRPGLAPGHDTKHINKNLPFLKKADKHHEKTWKNNRKTRNSSRAKIASPSFSWKYSSLSACKRKPCQNPGWFSRGHRFHPWDDPKKLEDSHPKLPRPSQGSIAVPWLVSTPGGKPEKKKTKGDLRCGLIFFSAVAFFGSSCATDKLREVNSYGYVSFCLSDAEWRWQNLQCRMEYWILQVP